MTTTSQTLSLEELKEVLPDPKKIVEGLDEYVIGQERAKKSLALMLLNRGILRLQRAGKIYLDSEIQKENVLLIGPTGVGKTALMRALAKVSGSPISLFDVTGITSGGYIGGKVEDIIANHVLGCEEWMKTCPISEDPTEFSNGRFVYNGHYDILLEEVENGIIYIDEIDKIAKGGSGKDVSGDMVQNELLKFLDVGVAELKRSGLPWPASGIKSVETKNIYFVCGGAFAGLEDIIKDRLSKNYGIGFTSEIFSKAEQDESEHIFQHVTTEDLIKYGFKPEFLGRLPIKTGLHSLTIDTLATIVSEPKNSLLKQYTNIFKVFGVDLVIEKDAILAIAKRAYKMKLGARSLKSIFNSLMSDKIYNVFSDVEKELVITKDMVSKYD